MARLGMVIDTRRCVGCMDCVVACKTENQVPEGMNRDWITTRRRGASPSCRSRSSERCNHCDRPPCVTCCPTGASHVDDCGGIVLVTKEECIGCKACLASCPYDARYVHPEGYADKCTFCVHRVEQGEDPACVAVCPTRCMHFGDLDDPQSEVSRLLASRQQPRGPARGGHRAAHLLPGVGAVESTDRARYRPPTARPPIPRLHVWGWEIPVYLFLGGFAAGIMILSGWVLWKGRRNPRPLRRSPSRSSGLYLLGLAAISLGMLALFLDLAHKPYVWRLYLTFQPWSPMSWGAWILLLVYPVLVAGVLLDPPLWLLRRAPAAAAAGRLGRRPRASRGAATGFVSIATGVALGIYTGVLLSALGARPLWNSALLGPLFLVSGLSTAAAFGHWASPEPEERVQLAWLDNLFLTVELGLIVLLLVGLLTSTAASPRPPACCSGDRTRRSSGWSSSAWASCCR